MTRRRWRPAFAAGLLLTILCAPASEPLRAGERMFHLLDQRDGLPAGEVVRLAQDSQGFIWLGSFGGLVRYDGEQMRRWAPERLNGHISVLATGPRREVVVRVEPGQGDLDPTALYRIVPDGVEPVTGPDGAPLRGVGDAAFGSDGQLCLTQLPNVLCRLADGQWARHAFDDGNEHPRFVQRGPESAILALTDVAIWRLDGRGGRHRIAAVTDPVAAVPHPDGSLFVASFRPGSPARLLRISASGISPVLTLSARPIDLVARGDVIWASFDRFLVAVRPDEPPEIIGPDAGLPSGGPLLVDREGSLWLGTYSGVRRLPEPETVIWNERDGLPSGHTRFLEVTGNTMWVGTWQGLGRLRFTNGRWEARRGSSAGADGMCLDGDGRLWMARNGVGLVRVSPDRERVYTDPGQSSWLGCARRPDGMLWLSTDSGLLVTSTDDRRPARIGPNPADPPGNVYFRRLLEDRRGRLWVAANNQVCHAASAAVLARTPSWTCRQIVGSRGVSAIVELADGTLWVSTDRSGVWRYDETSGDWRQLAGSASLPSFSLRRLVRSADNSVWILGHGTVARVRPDPESADGWTIEERLTGLQGLPSAAAEDILEMPNGALWITTIVGLVQVPARARRRPLFPPAVELVDATINGRHVASDSAPWRLASSSAVELRFAALSFLDRGLLLHEYRVHADAPWTAAPSGPAVFRFPDLAAGSFTVEVRASLDGRAWTGDPARVSFEVLPPWYQRSSALAVYALAAAAVLYVVYRLRLAFLLRLERQRTRIAMDLHDEIGSGLGSINILAGLAAERTVAGSPPATLVGQISETAAELGASLGEIVWSLRSRSTSLDALVSHLTERAVRLFPTGRTALTMAIPDTLPAVKLSLSARWNVALIALEALHNAARHAGATAVVLGLEPQGKRWRIWVQDDGRGPDAAESRSGAGLDHMRRRADDIGADLRFTRNESGGLTVSLVFDPQAGPRRT